MKPWTGISLMLEQNFVASVLPLFEKEEIEIIEWSFDTLFINSAQHPQWLPLLLNDYAKKGRLVGHGVRYSLLSGKWEKRHSDWLKQLSIEIKKYNYRYITEHYGFMTSDHFHKGAPLPVPMNKATLAIGQDRLKRLQQIVQLPIGIENLAFAFNKEQVKTHGIFLEKLIRPVDGFLILDIHNIWCQAMNFDIDPIEIIQSYPINKVREIHVSGGSWSDSIYSKKKSKIRRDTHDEAVPKEVFNLLKDALSMCSNVEAVIFERLGDTIKTKKDEIQFVKNFKQIKKIVSSSRKNEKFPAETIEKLKPKFNLPINPIENINIYSQQQLITDTLTYINNPSLIISKLQKDKKLSKDWNIDLWEDYMIETAAQLIKKWN